MKNTIKYIGLDVHKVITVIVVLNACGQVESRTQIKTNAINFQDFFRGQSGTVHVVLEEGTWSAWKKEPGRPGCINCSNLWSPR